MVSVILKKKCIIFSCIGILIFVSVILKKIKFIVIPICLHCCNIPKGYSSNSSKISDYVNIVEITATQHYTRIVQNRFPEQKILENGNSDYRSYVDLTSKRHGKSKWRAHQYFVYFESRIHVETSTSNRCHNFHVDSPFKIDVISTNFRREISTSNR